MFNLINYPGVCDEALTTLVNTRPEAYIKVEGGIYIPPISPKIRQMLETMLLNVYGEKMVKTKTNITVQTCNVCNNWRLKHLGAKYQSAVSSGWYRIVHQPKIHIEINETVFAFMDKFLREKAQKFLALDDVDAADIVSQFSEQYGSTSIMAPIKDAKVFVDANSLISHEVVIPAHIKSKLTEAIALVVQK